MLQHLPPSRTTGPLWREVERKAAAARAPQPAPAIDPAEALARLSALAALAGGTCTVNRTPTQRTRARQIIQDAAQSHGVTLCDMTGPSRNAKIVRARQEAMARIAANTKLSLPAIGALFGDRDHTTVLHAIQREAVRTGQTIRGWTPEASAASLDRLNVTTRRSRERCAR